MSLPTPATDAFLARWNPLQNAPHLLVRLEIAIPSALTLYFSFDPLAAQPGGFPWQPVMVETEPFSDPGDLLSPGPNLTSFGFTINNVRLIPQASGTASDLLNQYLVEGATVTAWLWDAGLTQFPTDALQRFKGIVQGFDVGDTAIAFRCSQRKPWNITLPPHKVNRTDDPNAPEGSLGICKPIVLGFFGNDGMDEPWPTGYPIIFFPKLAQEAVGASGGVVPGVLVDSGVGGADAKVIFADHALQFVGNTATQINVKVEEGNQLAALNGTDIQSDLLPDFSGFLLKDNKNVAYVGIPCVDVRPDGAFPNLALNPRAALDIFDETTYAIVQSTGGATRLAFLVGNIGQPGQMLGAEIVIAYRCSHTTTPAMVRYNRPDEVPAYPADIPLTAHNGVAAMEPVIQYVTLPVVDLTGRVAWNPGEVSTDWNLAAGDLLAFLNPATAGHFMHVFFMGPRIKYRRAQNVAVPPQYIGPSDRYDIAGRRERRAPGNRPPGEIYERGAIFSSAIYDSQARGRFFANVAGLVDASGTYTGVALELLERPADMVRYLLQAHGLEPAGNVETAINRFGSFLRARPRNVSIEGNQIQAAVHIGEKLGLSEVLERVCRQALVWCYLSPFDDKWKVVPWERRIAAADFPRKLEADDILEIEAATLGESQVINGVEVAYAYDFFRNRFSHGCSINHESSDGGFSSRGKRDQLLVIATSGAAQNNRLDLRRSAIVYAATFNAGTYTPAQMMVEIKRGLVALAISGAVWNVAWGGTIVAGHNDKIDFTVSGTTLVATVAAGAWTVTELPYQVQLAMRAVADAAADVRCSVGMLVLEGFNDVIDFNDGAIKKVSIPPGYYRDGGQLAAYVALALNSQSTNWTATYNTGTSKFAIGRTSGTATLLLASGSNTLKNAAALLGFSHVADKSGSASYTAENQRERGKVYVQAKGTVTLKWLTGANRANAAAVTLGHDLAADKGPALNPSGDYAIQDETFAIAEGTAFDLLWQSGTNTAISCVHVLGFKSAADDLALKWHRADRRRGDRETQAASSKARYGEKRPFSVQAIDLRNTEAALTVRDSILDLKSELPLPIKVRTHRLPDLERGRVIEIGDLSGRPSLKLPPRYGAGAWAGKLFQVIESQQYSGKVWHQEHVMIEVKSPLVGAATTDPDGAVTPTVPYGTAFVIWSDNRSGSYELYAARAEADSTLPWTAQGIEVSTGGTTAQNPFDPNRCPKAIVDSEGFSIMAWSLNPSTVIRAQRLNAAGAAQWAADGITVTGGGLAQALNQVICSDAARGAYVAWAQNSPLKVRVARIAQDGTFPSGWAAGGIGVAPTQLNAQDFPRICPDGSGGVIVVWTDQRSGIGRDLYCQRYSSAGAPLWATDGVLVSSATVDQRFADLISDGAGGAFIVWEDTRSGATGDIYATHITSAGARDLDGSWISNGNVICNVASTQSKPHLVSDGAAGFIVVWADNRSALYRLYAQRVNNAGNVQWTANGVDVMKANDSGGALDTIEEPQIVSDGAGGVIVASPTDTSVNIRAQRLNALGARQWAGTDGVVIATGASTRNRLRIAPDGAGGIVGVWQDARNAGFSNDVYAQRVSGAGVPLWLTNGVPVVSRTGDQAIPWVVTV